MDELKETQEAPASEQVTADQETIARSMQEDAMQDMLDEKVADTLLNSDMEVETSEDGQSEEAVSQEIVQQTIDAEERQETIDTRVLRDFDEGIITFGRDGVIRYINPAASMILGLTDNAVGKRYQELFGAENEALWEFLAQATMEKNASHRGDLLFRREDGSVARLNTSCICLRDDKNPRDTSYTIHFEDITEIDVLRRKRRESSAVFIGTMPAVSIWIYVVALWQHTGQRISQEVMTQFIHFIALVMFFYIRHYTHFSLEEMGLKYKGIAKQKATEAHEQLKSGGSFDAIAEKYAENADLAKETLYTNKSSLEINVMQYLASVNAPALSDVITSDKGTAYYIVQVTNINGEQLKDDLHKYLEDTNDFTDSVYSYYCKKHNVKYYDIDVYNLIKNNYPAFLVQD